MNDFTKEELEIIHLDICVYLNKSKLLKPPQHHIDLKDKVREMIDNYDAKVISAWHCEKCGHVQ
jgi:predicted methyltransferase